MRPLKAITLLVLASTLIFAKHPKIARDLDSADPSAMVDVIIQSKTPPTDAHHQMIRDRGGLKNRKSLDLVKGSLYSLAADNSGRTNSAGTSGYATITAPGNDPCATTARAGCLDWAALSSSDTAPAGKPALSPTVQLDSKTDKVMLVLGANLVWGDSLAWVSRALHGFSIVWGS